MAQGIMQKIPCYFTQGSYCSYLVSPGGYRIILHLEGAFLSFTKRRISA